MCTPLDANVRGMNNPVKTCVPALGMKRIAYRTLIKESAGV